MESRGTIHGGIGSEDLVEPVSDRVPIGGQLQGSGQRRLRSLAPLSVTPAGIHAWLKEIR